ncbi:MAG: hypothetical protein R3328_10355 [Planococcaceae bacterium]|nr:hypothetical protein [Planococcaceae bacterium]
MIGRKFLSAIGSCIGVMIIYFILEPSGFVIFMAMYLLPILLFYGLPSSILSDWITKKLLNGIIRGISAFVIHLFLAALFVIVPILLFSQWERELLFSDVRSLLDNFFFITAILSSFLFWFIDEFFRCSKTKKKWHVFKERFGDLRI